MAGRARGIGTHGQRPAEKAGNRGASNYCFGWFHVLILFVCDWCLVASAPGLRWGRRSNSTISHFMRVDFLFKRQKGCSFIPESRATRASPEALSFDTDYAAGQTSGFRTKRQRNGSPPPPSPRPLLR